MARLRALCHRHPQVTHAFVVVGAQSVLFLIRKCKCRAGSLRSGAPRRLFLSLDLFVVRRRDRRSLGQGSLESVGCGIWETKTFGSTALLS